MLRRSIAVVLLFLGASDAASALEQRCGDVLDWLLCINPSLSYSGNATEPPSPNRVQGRSDNPAAHKTGDAAGSHAAASPQRPRAPLSLDYRVINHTAAASADPRTISQAAKRPEGRERTMSKDEKEEPYREFLNFWPGKERKSSMTCETKR
jgi:hypothetical protein